MTDWENDWTRDPETGRSNSSQEFLALVAEVERLIRNHRLGDNPRDTAVLIMAQLAHRHGLALCLSADAAEGE